MFTRAPSLRFWLMVAMIASVVIGLGAAVLLFNHVQSSHELAADAAKARQEARTIAAQIRAGADNARLTALQELLTDDQITVYRAGRVVFQGPSRTGREFELRAEARFPGGLVRIADYASPESSTTLELTLITAGVLALVIAAAIGTATLVTRAVRRPVQRAINAAEQVSHGDLTARMGTSGPEELVKLGGAFDEMGARLEQADRDQRQFLADVAHEIATPVNAVSGFALALAEGAAQGEQERREAKGVIDVQTGVGIAPEHQKRIFERLYRIDSTRDRATGGSGLALAIVRHAVQSLRGHIELDSALGNGSEFRITVPADRSPAPPAGHLREDPNRM